jgi:uncharacterized membrane protein
MTALSVFFTVLTVLFGFLYAAFTSRFLPQYADYATLVLVFFAVSSAADVVISIIAIIKAIQAKKKGWTTSLITLAIALVCVAIFYFILKG